MVMAKARGRGDYGLNLRQILELLEEPMSVSALSKELGKGVHKLVLTGYLFALKDLGYVEDKIFPPSRIFRTRKEMLPEAEKRFESAKDSAPPLEEKISEALAELYPEISKEIARYIERKELESGGKEREAK